MNTQSVPNRSASTSVLFRLSAIAFVLALLGSLSLYALDSTIQQNVLLLHSFWGPGAADALVGWMRLPVRFIGGLVVSGLGLAGLLLLIGARLFARQAAHPRRVGQEDLLAAQSRD